MRRFLPVVAVLALMSACSPYTFNLSVDLRYSTPSGLNLAGKNLSVVSYDNGTRSDSLFLSGVCENFARRLESDYFSGQRRIGVFRAQKNNSRQVPSKQMMLDFLIESGSDLVFLFTLDSLGPVTSGDLQASGITSADSAFFFEAKIPTDIVLYIYDSMYKRDTVLSYRGSSETVSRIYTSGGESSVALNDKIVSSMQTAGAGIGRQASNIFLSEWKTVEFPLYHYDSGEWITASDAALNFNWRKAMDVWMSMLDTPNLQKRSCLEYNLAVASTIIGEKALAKAWLDRSDADCLLPQSSSLRRRIDRMR